jgi:transcriptional regulator with XRE-family HTH domain
MDTIGFLKSNEQKSTGSFVKEAQFLRDNWLWLKYSYAIALKVRKRMEELEWTQKQLASALGCTQQHISVLLNGKVNMTLETIAKLEQALGFDLIGVLTRFQDSDILLNKPSYLSESSHGDDIRNTSSVVEGYKARKKKGPKQIKQND